MPPMRERGDDIILLANAFLQQYNADLGKQIKGFTQGAVEVMMQHPWPGNVRELQNRLRRGIVVARGDRLTTEDMELDSSPIEGKGLQQAKDELEHKFIRKALADHNGTISKAADAIGVTRTTFYDLLKKHNLRAEDFREGRAEIES